MQTGIRTILFDLGGVLLRLHDPFEAFDLQVAPAEFMQQWLLSDAVRGLERGAMDIDGFAAAAVEEFGLPYGTSEFLQRFEAWPDGLYDGIPELLEQLGRTHTLALLSNTNEVHWNRSDIAGVLEPRLQQLFLSYQTGLLKPDVSAFRSVLAACGCEPQEVFFLDDNPLNVKAASQCGMHAVLTRGYEELLQNLELSRLA